MSLSKAELPDYTDKDQNICIPDLPEPVGSYPVIGPTPHPDISGVAPILWALFDHTGAGPHIISKVRRHVESVLSALRSQLTHRPSRICNA